MKLEKADARPYSKLTFEIKAEEEPRNIKIELKRNCHQNGGGTECKEVSILNFGGVGPEWQVRSVNLADFVGTGWPGFAPLQSWNDLEELVFTFEGGKSRPSGVVYLDNIVFEK